MKTQSVKKIIKAFTIGMAGIFLLPMLGGCQKKPVNTVTLDLPRTSQAIAPAEPEKEKNPQELVEEIVVLYGRYGKEADATIDGLLLELKEKDPDLAEKWGEILTVWKNTDTLAIHDDILPDGLPDTDELCIVVLGFQLNPDGSMRE